MITLPSFGIAQTLLQLKSLGYVERERVYIRCIAGKRYNVRADKLYPFDGYLTTAHNGFTFTRLFPQSKGGGEDFTVKDGYQYLLNQNNKGYGVYLVVNAGGRKDEDITRCPALFYECDDISKDEQWKRIKRLPFDPSQVIETRNSLHVFYRTAQENPDGWRTLQQRLIQLMNSDPAIHNESRLMRLAGFYHQKKGLEPSPITIQLANDAVYQRAEFETLLPAWDESRWSETREQISNEELNQRLEAAKLRRESTLLNVDGFPLGICLSKDDRHLIASGAGKGQRNHLGFKLASNLIATANWLKFTGYSYSDDERDLFEEYCDRCTPSIKYREREQIWKSAGNSNPTPSLPDEAIENCIKAWQWQQIPDREKRQKHDLEPLAADYKEYVDWENEQEEIEKAIASEKKLYRFKNWLKKGFKRILKGRDKKSPKQSEKQRILVYNPTVGLPTIEQWKGWGCPIIEFKEEDRLTLYQEAINKSFAIHDCSFMGAGKSHAVPLLKNKSGKNWYISPDHRNPSIKAIENDFTDLVPRSKYGFYRDPDTNKLKTADKETDPSLIETEGNCIRADWFSHLANLGYDPNKKDSEDGLNSICATCPILGQCRSSGYLSDRKNTLEEEKIRADLASLPKEEYDYSNDVAFIEEPSRSLRPTKTLATTYDSLLIGLDRLRDKVSPSTYQSLDAVIQSIKLLMARKNLTNEEKIYGITSEVIKKDLPSHQDKDSMIDELEATDILKEVITEVDKIELSKSEYKKHHSSAKLVNETFRKEAYRETQENLDNLPPNALIHLLKFIRGDQGIAARLNGQVLTLTIDDRSSYSPTLNQMGAVIFLDSTMSTQQLQERSGLNRPIITIRQKIDKPLGNLTVHNTQTEGLGSSTYSKTALKRVSAVTSTINQNAGYSVPSIALKAYQEQLGSQGYWFLDNRGSNDFEGQENLIAIGSPYPNVGAIQDEYYALYGTLDGFEEYYAHLVESEVLQLAGRQRCHRHKDKQFNLYFINSGLDLDFLTEYGATVINQNGFEFSPEAGNAFQYRMMTIITTIEALAKDGKKITQDAIAKVLGVTQSSVSQLLKNAGLTLSELTEKIIRHPIKDSNREPYNSEWYFKDSYFRALLKVSPLELLEEFIPVILDVGWRDFWESVLCEFPELVQVKILSVLTGLFITEFGLPETVFDTQ